MGVERPEKKCSFCIFVSFIIGSGTFFKMSECIYKFTNVRDVDGKKLSQLIER